MILVMPVPTSLDITVLPAGGFIPDPFVQRKVVSLLEGLDQKITFADSALFSLNRLKASLMQQLFI